MKLKILEYINVEELRTKICLEKDYDNHPYFILSVKRVKDKFKEIEEMLDSQLKVHKHWSVYGKHNNNYEK